MSSNPAAALAVAAPLATRWIERTLLAHEPPLTVAQYLALRAVEEGATTGGDLARHTGVSAPAASQLVAGLAQAGWLDRTPDPDDRRRTGLALSAEGLWVLASATARLETRLEPLLEALHPPERDALAALEAVLTGTAPPRRPPPPRPPHHGPRPRRPA
jgi:DNA-binding MarR family transcriptional regulator